MNQAFFSPGDDCANAIIRCIRQTEKQIDICVFTISDNQIADAIFEAFSKGVIIRIITDNDKQHDQGSDIGRLKQSGIAVRTDFTEAHMHHKFAIFDEKLILSGSYNWTLSARDENYENILISDNEKLIREFSGEFERLWRKFDVD